MNRHTFTSVARLPQPVAAWLSPAQCWRATGVHLITLSQTHSGISSATVAIRVALLEHDRCATDGAWRWLVNLNSVANCRHNIYLRTSAHLGDLQHFYHFWVIIWRQLTQNPVWLAHNLSNRLSSTNGNPFTGIFSALLFITRIEFHIYCAAWI